MRIINIGKTNIKAVSKLLKTSFLATAGILLITNPVMAGSSVVVTEFMADPVIISDYRGEWVELYNQSDEAVDMSGWSFEGAVFPEDTEIMAKSAFLICRDGDIGYYPNEISCDLVLDFHRLDNHSDETVTLKNDVDEVVDSFKYDGSDINPAQSTIVDHDNDTGLASEGENDENIFYTDRTNDYVAGPADETGTPGDVTLLDLIDLTPGLSRFDQMIDSARSFDCPFVQTLISDEDGLLSVFAPSDEAIANLPVAELERLEANHDELCEFIAYHLVLAEDSIGSDLITTLPMTLPTLSGDMIRTMLDGDDNLIVVLNGGKAYADQALITSADNEAYNGVLHIIDDVLLPQNPAVTINPVISSGSQPELTGTYQLPAMSEADLDQEKSEPCVLVRIDGQPYLADLTEDGTWSIPAGIISVDPEATDTLYTVVLRYLRDGCNFGHDRNPGIPLSLIDLTDDEPTIADCDGYLSALTMQRGVVSAPEENTDDDGEVLSDTDTNTASNESVTTPVLYSTKGNMGDDALYDNDVDDSSQDDGITDDQASSDTSNQDQNDNKDSAASWYWWLVGAGTVALVWYMIWRRQES